MGVGIGVIVASLKASPAQVASDQAELRRQFIELKAEMQGRTSRGEPVPPLAWELMTNAGSALVEGDTKTARKRIAEAERLLQAQPGTAQK